MGARNWGGEERRPRMRHHSQKYYSELSKDYSSVL